MEQFAFGLKNVLNCQNPKVANVTTIKCNSQIGSDGMEKVFFNKTVEF